MIRAFYGSIPRVWQAVWPDSHGRFLGNDLYELLDSAQPLL